MFTVGVNIQTSDGTSGNFKILTLDNLLKHGGACTLKAGGEYTYYLQILI